MSIWHSIILGVIEGITEFLPISSTGHLILANSLLGISDSSFTKSFDIIIQLGAILAVVVLYWKKIWNIGRIKKLIVAFIPTGVIGLALYKVVKTHLLGNNSVVLWSLFLGGITLIAFEYWNKKKANTENPAVISSAEPSFKQAFIIGLFQSLAIIPGVSRSGATIVGGMSQGLSRVVITEFSFMLAIPTMLAASGLDLLKNYSLFSSDQIGVLTLGFVTSFVVALFSITFLLRYIQKHDFVPFGLYRILLALAFFLIFV